MDDDLAAPLDAPPPTRSPAVKFATLLFSGGLAALAIVRGSSGCTSVTAAELDDEEDVDELLPRWRRARARPSPGAIAEDAPGGRFGGATSDVEVGVPKPSDRRALGGAGVDPEATNARDPTPPARYFGGSKSDSDVWGGLDARDLSPRTTPPPAGRARR